MVLPVLYDYFAAGEHYLGYAPHLHPFVQVVVNVHVVRLGADSSLLLWIENYNIGVAAYGDSTLAREQSKQFRRCRREDFYQAVHIDKPRHYTFGVEQVEPVLNARPSVGYPREIVPSQGLLVGETEGAMVGGHHLKVIPPQPIPELILMPLLP